MLSWNFLTQVASKFLGIGFLTQVGWRVVPLPALTWLDLLSPTAAVAASTSSPLFATLKYFPHRLPHMLLEIWILINLYFADSLYSGMNEIFEVETLRFHQNRASNATFYATKLTLLLNSMKPDTTKRQQALVKFFVSLPFVTKNLLKCPFPPSPLPAPLLICSPHLSLEHKTFPVFAKIISCNQSKTNYFTATPCTLHKYTNRYNFKKQGWLLALKGQLPNTNRKYSSQIHTISKNKTGKG